MEQVETVRDLILTCNEKIKAQVNKVCSKYSKNVAES